MKCEYVKQLHVHRYFRENYPRLKVSTGFLKLLDLHMESVLKRAAHTQKNYLDAPAALRACRHPFAIPSSEQDYEFESALDAAEQAAKKAIRENKTLGIK